MVDALDSKSSGEIHVSSTLTTPMGYTLPVYAAAAAKAALEFLALHTAASTVELETLPGRATLTIHSCAPLSATAALAITISQPTDPLDLTRNTPVWALVQCEAVTETSLILKAGEGLGHTLTGEPAIYAYARRLLEANLSLPSQTQVTVTIILPQGRALAERTSNAAFGIVEGLALLGTRAEALPHNHDDQIEQARQALRLAATAQLVVLCVGSSGQQSALRQGFQTQQVILAGNWLGVMLVEAAILGHSGLVLWGYHGKLAKLAAGIFHTSSHVADGRRESLAAIVAEITSDLADVRAVLAAATAAAAETYLRDRDLAAPVFTTLAERVAQRARAYIQKYADRELAMAVVLTDRQGQPLAQYWPVAMSLPPSNLEC